MYSGRISEAVVPVRTTLASDPAAEVGAVHAATALLEVELRESSEMAKEAPVAWVQPGYSLPDGDEGIAVWAAYCTKTPTSSGRRRTQ